MYAVSSQVHVAIFNLYFHILCLCKVMDFLKGTSLLSLYISECVRASGLAQPLPNPPSVLFLIWIISHLLYVCQANRFFQIQSP